MLNFLFKNKFVSWYEANPWGTRKCIQILSLCVEVCKHFILCVTGWTPLAESPSKLKGVQVFSIFGNLKCAVAFQFSMSESFCRVRFWFLIVLKISRSWSVSHKTCCDVIVFFKVVTRYVWVKTALHAVLKVKSLIATSLVFVILTLIWARSANFCLWKSFLF